jgi:hypothetical protein
MQKSLVVAFSVIGLGLGLAVPEVSAMTRYVNCDAGQTIQDAIEKSESRAERLEIFVKGTCRGDITIRRPDVTIDGNNETTIAGSINVFASTTWLNNLTVTAPGRGVVVSDNSARLLGVTLSGNEGVGLYIRRGGFAWFRGGVVSGNSAAGIYLENGSLDADNLIVADNADDGILADSQSNVVLRSNTRIERNGAAGLSIILDSLADLRDNAFVSGNTGLGVFISEDSAVRITSGDVRVDGEILCGDEESSFFNRGGGTAYGPINCSGF